MSWWRSLDSLAIEMNEKMNLHSTAEICGGRDDELRKLAGAIISLISAYKKKEGHENHYFFKTVQNW
jgi:hypothetical protein